MDDEASPAPDSAIVELSPVLRLEDDALDDEPMEAASLADEFDKVERESDDSSSSPKPNALNAKNTSMAAASVTQRAAAMRFLFAAFAKTHPLATRGRSQSF